LNWVCAGPVPRSQVEAPDAASTIEAAVKEFNVDEAHRSRLIAQPIK
jgi:hypothetical protein